MKRKALIALIISTCVVVVGCVGLVFWALAATQVTVKSSLVVSYKPTPQVVCATSATYQKTTDETATPFQTANLEFLYGGPDTTRNIEASSDALELDDTDTYLVTEYTFTNKNRMPTYDLTIRLTDNAVCTNMARKYYFGNDIAELSVSEKKDKIINSGVDNLSLSTQKLVLGYQETGRIYMLLQITPGIVANYNSDNTNLFLFRMTCAERGTEVAYLSKEWPSKVGSVSGVVTFTKDVSKIAGLANNVSVGTNSETDTSAFVPADGVEDVTAYWGDDKTNIVIYSPATIYAPQDCSYMFSGDYGSSTYPTEINFDNFNTSKVTNMSRMFSEAYLLVTLDVSSFDTSNVTDMSWMFNVYHTRAYECYLETLIFGENFNTSKVTNMRGMFYAANKLTSLDVSYFNTSNVTDMSSMFSGCYSLTSLTFGSNFDTSNVTDMSSMFSGCSLTSLDVSNFDTSKVTTMQSMFSGCSLTSLDVSNFDTSKVTTMYYMFSACSSLTSLDVSHFDTSNVTDMQYMFSGCTSLTSLNLGNFDLASCTSFGDMLARCSALASITLPYNLQSGYTIILPASAYFDGSDGAYDIIGTETSGTTVACSTVDSKVTLVAKNVQVAFLTRNWTSRIRDDSALNTVTKSIIFTNDPSKISGLSNSVSVGTNSTTSTDDISIWVEEVRAYWGSDKSSIVIYSQYPIIAPQNCNRLFTVGLSDRNYLSKLTTLDLTNFDTSKVTNMSFMFSYCSALTSLDVSNFDTSNVTDMTDIFYRCSSLTSLNLSNFNTSKVTTMQSMFASCSSLTSLNVSNIDTSNVTDMRSMFSGCSSFISLDVSNFDTSKVISMENMFSGCSSFTSLDVSNFDTSNVESMYGMFKGCSSLTSLNLGNFNLASCTSFGYMLEKCSALASLTLPYNLKNGKAITLPASAYFNGSDGAYGTIGVETSGTTVACSTVDSKVTLVAKNVQAAFLTRNWTSRIRDDSALNKVTTSIIFTNDSSKISGLSNSVSVGTNSPTSTDDVGIWVEDVRAYWGSNKSTIVIYSPVTIYAPGDCSYLFTIGQSQYGSMISKLTTLDLTNFDTSRVKYMKGMFRNYKSLTSLDVSNFDTSSVTDMTSMFESCSSLTSLDVSNFDTSSVIYMSSMFASCSSLTSLDVSNFDTSSVANMSSMFNSCKSLTSLNLGNFNLASCNNVNGMLSSCSALASIILPYNLRSGTISLPASNYYNGSNGPFNAIGTRTSSKTVACSTADTKVTLTKR